MSSVTPTHGTHSALRYLWDATVHGWHAFHTTLQRAERVMLSAGVTTSPVERSALVVVPVTDPKHVDHRQRSKSA